ncbi:hypothetical protein, partial [Gordonibacter sp.]|uniref:hypothetical protein n=1 Tax=Gordonibacter sp. TaxID=1968902 RepID=UPI002FC64F86
YKPELPNLALLTGQKVRLEIGEEQQVLFIDGGTGECFDDEDECEAFDEPSAEHFDEDAA